MTPVSTQDLGVMLQLSVRYALGRSTYVVGEVIDLLRGHWHAVERRERACILADIRTELERARAAKRTVGDQQDHDQWEAVWRDLAHAPSET
jgi:hypothetical protein